MVLDLELLLTCKIEINSGGKSHEKVRLNTAETSAGNQLWEKKIFKRKIDVKAWRIGIIVVFMKRHVK